MPICVYCRNTSETPFPKEHVVPRALGRFRKNLTLDCVCRDCNALFARDLELFLAQDSIESLLRVRYGVSPKSGRRKLGKSRLTVRVNSPGDWHGARVVVERNETGTSMTAEPLPQVAFRKLGETNWTWFLEEELSRNDEWERYRTDAETKIVGKPTAVVQRLARKLEGLGIKFKERGAFERQAGVVEVFAEPILDDIIFRAVAKIGFNFLTHFKGTAFVLRPDFDAIRDFVRQGTKPPHQPVVVTTIPILYGDSLNARQTYGHVIVVGWDKVNQGIVCLVSLFNHLTYHVRLCANYSGVWHPLSIGRHFDVQTLTVSEVRGARF